MIIHTILEGLGLGLLICLYCVIGIRNGAIGLVHLYSAGVQARVIQLGLTTKETIRKRGKLMKAASGFSYLIYVLACVYGVNGARGFVAGFLQMLVILEIANIVDRLVIDEWWVGHSEAWIIPGTENLRPYITVRDKKKKWFAGTVGFAAIAAAVAGIACLVCR